MPDEASDELLVRNGAPAAQSASDAGVTQPLASQLAPLEKVAHWIGGNDGGMGGVAGGDGVGQRQTQS